MKKLFLIAIAIFAFISCSEEVIIEKRELGGIEYFSLKQGKYQGCMNLDGNVVIPLKRKYTSAYPSKLKPEYPLYYQVSKNGWQGQYSAPLSGQAGQLYRLCHFGCVQVLSRHG